MSVIPRIIKDLSGIMVFTPTSPAVSPTKNIEFKTDSPFTLDPKSTPTEQDNYRESHHSVNNRVARLSISEPPDSKRNIIQQIKSIPKLVKTKSNELVEEHIFISKRRRSSASVPPNITSSRQNSISGKIVKKKKRASKPITFSINEKSVNKRISIKDIRDLSLYLTNTTNNMPQWIKINNRAGFRKLIVLFNPGLQPEDYGLPDGTLFSDNIDDLSSKFIKSDEPADLVVNSIPVSAPGSRMSLFSAYNSFVNVGLTKPEKQELRASLSKNKITINDLLIKVEKLLENNYPIHPDTPDISEEYKEELIKTQINDGWVNTYEFEHDESHIFGLDCEMCMSEDGLVLTRVSIVDFQMKVLYDELVKPDVPIIDYLTQYSGITKEMLEPVTKTYQDVQQEILKIVSSSDILIGHSLQSDFNVLKMRHPRIVDTAVIFDHKAGPPFKPSLRYLASTYLNSDIQKDGAKGHNPIEDAKTCIELTKLKILNGLGFGVNIDTENLFHRIGKMAQKKSLILNDSVANHQPTVVTHKYDSSIRCNSDAEILNRITENVDNYDFFVGRLRDLEFARHYSKPSILSKRVIDTDPEITVKNFVSNFKQMYNGLPSGSFVVVLSGSGNTKEWTNLMNTLNKCNKEDRVSMKKKMEYDIEKAIVRARDGVATLIVKNDQ